MFQGLFEHSIIKKAQEKGLVKINFVNLRGFGIGKHKTVDDRPYGGGAGMVLRVDVLEKAINSVKKGVRDEKVLLLDPRGKTYQQETAENLSKLSHVIIVCGHYEGFDERVRDYIDQEISIGDYILTGGEIPAAAIVDSIIRLVPCVLKKEEASEIESFSKIDNKRMLEFPQYTRPSTYKGKSVPEILLSGDQEKIRKYRIKEAIRITKEKRPEIVKKS